MGPGGNWFDFNCESYDPQIHFNAQTGEAATPGPVRPKPCLAGPAWLALPAGWHCLLAGTAWLAFGSLRFERAFGLLSSRDSSWTELTADDYCRCWAGRKSRGRTGAGMNMPCRLCVG